MAIFDETDQSEGITEGWRALDLFTDRCEAIGRFCEYLNEDPPPNKILFFYGEGGNGKSLLLSYLRANCCKRFRPEDWNHIKAKQGDEFVAEVVEAETTQTLPTSLIDFGMQPRGDLRPQEDFSALLKMRGDLASQGLRFPLFDFACIWHLHKARKLSREQLKNLIPSEESDVVSEIIDAVTGTTVGTVAKVVLNLVNKHAKENLILWLRRRRLNEDNLRKIEQMDPEKELLDKLPFLFADDLNTAMAVVGAPPRVVLFFDTHEALSRRGEHNNRFFYHDEWLRKLLGKVEYKKRGIVIVIAGRDRPNWERPSKYKITSAYLDHFLVGHLSWEDADAYLERAEVNDPAMRKHLIAYTQVEPNQVHPLYLAMCADIVLSATARSVAISLDEFSLGTNLADKQQELIDRLARYVDEDIASLLGPLCMCRSFNREIYFKMAESLGARPSEQGFRRLTRFSFVWPAEHSGEEWYRMHELLRRLVRTHNNSFNLQMDIPFFNRQADEIMEAYYRGLYQGGNLNAIAEALYHAHQLDAKRSIDEWTKLFNKSLKTGCYDLCRAFLEVRNEFTIESDSADGQISDLEGRFYYALARYDEAKQKYLKAAVAFDKALCNSPNDVYLLDNKGHVLRGLGQLLTKLSQHREALNAYRQAITAYEESHQRAPGYISALYNKGNALTSLGELLTKLSKYKDALSAYQQAIAACDGALQRRPDNFHALNNKGNALRKLGELLAQLSRQDEALIVYQQAVTVCDEALRRAPDDSSAFSNKGNSLTSLGQLLAHLSQHEDALSVYQQAVATFDEALRRAPEYIIAFNNKGFTLTSLGQLLVQLSREDEALSAYEQAIIDFDKALQYAPNDIYVLSNKGFVLTGLGKLLTKLLRYKDALIAYQQAVTACDEALRRAPNDTGALSRKGDALMSRGKLMVQLSQHEDALESLKRALSAFSRSLEIAPSDKCVHDLTEIAQNLINDLSKAKEPENEH